MASNLECVGLAVSDREAFKELVESVLPTSEQIGKVGDVAVHRWEDPSGARLVITIRGNEIVDLLPSFAGTDGARLSDLRAVNDEASFATVVNADGETLTKLSAAVEQQHLLSGNTFEGRASIVALGADVSVHADAAAFAASDASLLSPNAEREDRADKPLRMASDSFLSYSVFGPAEEAQPYARLFGTVLRADRRTVVATGQSFIAARVSTIGIEADVCFPDIETIPAQGNIVGGDVFLIASLLGLPEPTAARRSWLPWRRR